MAGFQQVIIVGNLGRDPELRYTQAGVAVCSFSVAVTSMSGQGEARQEKTVWFRVSAWRELGERCKQYLSKGRQVMVIGTIEEPRIYTNNAGQPATSLEITARDVRFLGGRGEGGESGGYEDSGGDYGGAPQKQDDIPF